MNSIKIKTARLFLRPLEVSDAEQLYCYRSLKDVTRFQQFKPRYLSDAVAFVQSTASKPGIPGTWHQLGIFLKDTPELIGDIGIHFLNQPGKSELGCTVAPKYWGRGYAPEALSAVISHLSRRGEIRTVTALVDPDNTRSRMLFRKLGFSLVNADIWETYQLDNTRGENRVSANGHFRPAKE